MPGPGHQTVFKLCLALIILASVSVVSVALLLIERQDTGILQRNIRSLQQENAALRSQLEDDRNGLVSQPQTAP